jgi:hypothetical protein
LTNAIKELRGMKKITVVLTVCIVFAAFAMSFVPKNTLMNLQAKGEGHESVSDKLFIPADYFKKFNLDPEPVINPRIHDWASMDKTNKYAVVNDIRWEFDNAVLALDYQKKNLSANSQKGVELHPQLNVTGVTEMHVYKEAESITNLNKDLGINTMEYCYLFVVDKVVAKVWVKVNGDIKVEEASVFAREASLAIKKALGK